LSDVKIDEDKTNFEVKYETELKQLETYLLIIQNLNGLKLATAHHRIKYYCNFLEGLLSNVNNDAEGIKTEFMTTIKNITSDETNKTNKTNIQEKKEELFKLDVLPLFSETCQKFINLHSEMLKILDIYYTNISKIKTSNITANTIRNSIMPKILAKTKREGRLSFGRSGRIGLRSSFRIHTKQNNATYNSLSEIFKKNSSLAQLFDVKSYLIPE
jgi:hypothetical protein